MTEIALGTNQFAAFVNIARYGVEGAVELPVSVAKDVNVFDHVVLDVAWVDKDFRNRVQFTFKKLADKSEVSAGLAAPKELLF